MVYGIYGIYIVGHSGAIKRDRATAAVCAGVDTEICEAGLSHCASQLGEV